jgi:rubrerythrin
MSNNQLADFLAHSVELESEALERYLEMADTMDIHHNTEVADFFRRMANEARHHLEEVAEYAQGITLPTLRAWEFNWPEAEPPETLSYEAQHYRMSLRQAMELALQNERAAELFYRSAADKSTDEETVRVATLFADEEHEHGAQLETLIAAQPINGANLLVEDDEPHMPE